MQLKRLLKTKVLTALLTDLETLAGRNITFSLYDAQGEALFGPAVLLAEELETAQHAKKELAQVADLTGSMTQKLIVEGELIGVLVATENPDLVVDTRKNMPSAPLHTSLRSTSGGGKRRLSLQLDAAANLLIHLVDQTIKERALAQETLERYREINLLYRIQETIGAQLDLNQISSLVLKESVRVIQVDAGVLLLLIPDELTFDVQAHYGEVSIIDRCSYNDTIAGWVARNCRAVIVNDVSADPRCGPADQGARSLLCVPLTAGDKCIGALTLYDKTSTIFTASDQKLLTALAFQATVAIETAREVEARESRLKAQIRELRIEIDEIRKQHEVESITTTEYFARLQKSAQEMRREFEEGL